jgi:hypothetical protein
MKHEARAPPVSLGRSAITSSAATPQAHKLASGHPTAGGAGSRALEHGFRLRFTHGCVTFRVLTVRGSVESLEPHSRWSTRRPRVDTVDHGTEFTSRALDEWAYRHGVKLDFTCPGKPTQNGHIESFNGRLRDECRNVQQFLSIDDARRKIEAWRHDCNHCRPHSSLGPLTPREFVELGQQLGAKKPAFSWSKRDLTPILVPSEFRVRG